MPHTQPEQAVNPIESIQPAYPKDDEAASSSALSEADVQPYAVRYQEEGGADCTPYAVAYGDQDGTDSSNTKTSSSCSNDTENSAFDRNLHDGGYPLTTVGPTSVQNVLNPNPMYEQDIRNLTDRIAAQNAPNPMPNANQEVRHGNYAENVTSKQIMIGGRGKDPGKLNQPHGAAVSAENEVFVSDTNNNRVQVLSVTGVFLRLFPTVIPGEKGRSMYPSDIAVDNEGHAWVVGKYRSDPDKIYVVQYNQDGQSDTTIDLKRKDWYPKIAVDTRNNKTIVLASNEILIFQPDGSFDGSFGMEKGVYLMRHITSDKDGNVLITDKFTSNVHVYNHSGHPILAFRPVSSIGRSRREGDLRGICTDSVGHIIVANTAHRRVDMFTSRGEFIRTIVNIENPHDTRTNRAADDGTYCDVINDDNTKRRGTNQDGEYEMPDVGGEEGGYQTLDPRTLEKGNNAYQKLAKHRVLKHTY
ncbi:TRIM3 [Branchiostoma lanceolatum]|uniref:TRIM3 protein n=1 Tax=Branchiostoma lanceolatum TaxID=7740 RepID=A0A8J9YW97_BRALA|nr:TRIM3 [Branchiostoma lanceolatum]